MGYEFRILGPLECWWTSSRLPVAGTRQQRLVAALLLDAGQTLSSARLAEVLWEDPPPTSRQQLHKVVSGLRRAWSVAGMRDVESVIGTDGPGYRFSGDPRAVDAWVFQHRVRQAAPLRQSGRTQEAAARLRSALRLWRGPTLSGVSGRALQGAMARLDEQRLSVSEDCIGLELDLGRYQEVVAELGLLIAENPFRERLVELLMLALYRSGRQSEALEVYHRLRTRMAQELGIEPTLSSRTLHARILHQDPTLHGARTPATALVATNPQPHPPPAPAGPSCLPDDPPHFTGRTAAIAALDRMLDERARTVVIAAIVGTAGVGKSALALHWAHQVRHLFPDGQVYVDLGGVDHTAAMAPVEALARMLKTLGVLDGAMPCDLDARAGLLRSTLAGKRVLLVLDNAVSAEQVQPLLPGIPGCLVVVTSRNALIRLVVLNDATCLTLDTLSMDESKLLVERILGTQRVRAQPETIRKLVRLCGYRPPALRIAAAALASCRHQHIIDTVGQLAAADRPDPVRADSEGVPRHERNSTSSVGAWHEPTGGCCGTSVSLR